MLLPGRPFGILRWGRIYGNCRRHAGGAFGNSRDTQRNGTGNNITNQTADRPRYLGRFASLALTYRVHWHGSGSQRLTNAYYTVSVAEFNTVGCCVHLIDPGTVFP